MNATAAQRNPDCTPLIISKLLIIRSLLSYDRLEIATASSSTQRHFHSKARQFSAFAAINVP